MTTLAAQPTGIPEPWTPVMPRPTNARIDKTVHGEGRFVAFTPFGALASPDGTTWQMVAYHPLSNEMTSAVQCTPEQPRWRSAGANTTSP